MAFPVKPSMWCPGIRSGHPLANGLEGFWPMWEGSGDRLMDVSGNGKTGSAVDAPPWSSAAVGQGLMFDGVSQ
ncbi:MAG TPA: hypothetical protein VM487_15010, partial [Phycisphaerae bacterium]|nr:hypothetical protein [Phycisphaerae bacterium]